MMGGKRVDVNLLVELGVIRCEARDCLLCGFPIRMHQAWLPTPVCHSHRWRLSLPDLSKATAEVQSMLSFIHPLRILRQTPQ